MSRWQDHAACKGSDLVLFYGPGEGEPRETQMAKDRRVQHAKLICRSCPVQPECLEFHLQMGPAQYGVAGGLDEDERAAYRRRLQRKASRERRAS
ncbi:WhiB family transcriptional regulator [Nonomuraea sp. NPDC047897]|uniref:WhiB family transcriptional regulator n=1 Tax=Nonomuraea sp. NPDC047897 TaxID=3364346 RepID=UPI00371044D9